MTSSVRIDDLQKKYEQNSRRYFAPLASELRRAGNARRAVAICEAGLAADPEHLSGHVVLAQALADMGDSAGAERSFGRAVELDPENIIALRSLGDLARDRGDREAARRWYQHALEADPRDPELATRLSTLDAALATEEPAKASEEATVGDGNGRDAGAGEAAGRSFGAGRPPENARLADDGPGNEALASPRYTGEGASPPLSALPAEELNREFQQQREAEEFTAGFFAAVLEADRAAASREAEAEAAEGRVDTDAVTSDGVPAEEAEEPVARSSETELASVANGPEYLDDLMELPTDRGGSADVSAEPVGPDTGPEILLPPDSVSGLDSPDPVAGWKSSTSTIFGAETEATSAAEPESDPVFEGDPRPADEARSEATPVLDVHEPTAAVQSAELPQPDGTADAQPGALPHAEDEASHPPGAVERPVADVPGAEARDGAGGLAHEVGEEASSDSERQFLSEERFESRPEWAEEDTPAASDEAAIADMAARFPEESGEVSAEMPSEGVVGSTPEQLPSESRETVSPESEDDAALQDRLDESAVRVEWREEIPSERSRIETSSETTGHRESAAIQWSEVVPEGSHRGPDFTHGTAPEESTDEAAAIAARAEGHTREDDSSRLPFVTVTMGKLLLQQGFRDDALRLFRQLATQHPDDRAILEQLAELEEELHPSGAAGGGVTVGSWLRELARMRPESESSGEDADSSARPATDGVDSDEDASALLTVERDGEHWSQEEADPPQGVDAPARGDDLLTSAAAAAASAVSWEGGGPDPSIDDFLFSEDPLEWGEVASPTAAPVERAAELSLEELLNRPVSADDEAAAGALASATLAMQHDQETDAQLAEAASEDPGSLEQALTGPSSVAEAGRRETGGFSFEQFFRVEPTAPDRAHSGGSDSSPAQGSDFLRSQPPAATPDGDEEAAAREADLADFHAWLSGLSKS